MFNGLLVHYAEIALKGKNRGKFEQCLADNIDRMLEGLSFDKVQRRYGRMWIAAQSPTAVQWQTALQRLNYACGVSSLSPAVMCPWDVARIKEAAWDLAKTREYASFRISTRRADKSFPMTSMELNKLVGGHVWEHRNATIKMKHADLDIRIEIAHEGAMVYADKHAGAGGLPVGISGDVCVMLSGGIDSPVAAYRMMRRGCRAVFVHFHGHPFVTRASAEKAQELVEQLMRFQGTGRLYSVAFGDIQRAIVDVAQPSLRVVLYRRLMVRIAYEIAKNNRCRALVTGDALGQVASQTLTNMVTIDEATPMTILRPLVGLDKQEIIDQAMNIGTYDISIQPDQDCCSLFVPRHPETHASLSRVRAAESKLDIAALVEQSVTTATQDVFSVHWETP